MKHTEKKNRSPLLIIGAGLLIAASILIIGGATGKLGGLALLYKNATSGKLDGFAQCLKDKGVTFYGAFWCPHCQNQKALFGASERLLPYVECSNPDGQSKTLICTQKNIESYPTWEFADGSRLTGEIPLATLAQKSGCTLPQ